MARRIRKAGVSCPRCGHGQQEAVHCISTICRGCGSAFDIGSTAHVNRPVVSPLRRAFFHRPPRTVHCYRCGSEHEVSGYAATTICPGCNGQIQLSDVTISGASSRTVDTRGYLVVERGASLNTLYVVCHSAKIEGRISGVLLCEERLLLGQTGRSRVRIDADSLLIERHGALSTPLAVAAREVVVAGTLEADICCWGSVTIKKHGRLTGNVTAKAFRADKGALFQGALSINRDERPKRQLALAKADFPELEVVLPRALPPRVSVI